MRPNLKNVSALLQKSLIEIEGAVRNTLKNGGEISRDESRAVVDGVHLIIDKAMEAMRNGNYSALGCTLFLVSQAMEHYHAELTEKLWGVPAHASNLLELFRSVVMKNPQGSTEAQIELLSLFEIAGESVQHKDRMGEVLMGDLMSIFAGLHMETPPRSFVVKRLFATLLLSLVKQSRDNKARVSSLQFCGTALQDSTDFFFQMQCVELIFRVTRVHRHTLKSAGLPRSLEAGIEKLPNDPTLVEKLVFALEQYHATLSPPRLYTYPVIRADAGNEILHKDVRSFFTPTMMLVFDPDFSGMNLTVDYSTVRSVRITRDNKIVIRVHTAPPGTEKAVNPDDDERGNITLHMNTQTIADIKQSDVNRWITEAIKKAKHTKPSAPAHQPAPTAVAAPAPAAPVGAPQAAVAMPNIDFSRPVAAPVAVAPSSISPKASKAKNPGSAEKRKAQAATAAPPNSITELAGNVAGGSAKKRKVEDFSARVPDLSHLAPTALRFDEEIARPRPAERARNAAPNLSQLSTDSQDVSVEEMLSQLKHVISDKVHQRRTLTRQEVNDTLMCIQQHIDAFKEQSRRDRDAYEQVARQEFEMIQKAETAVRDRISATVVQLNAGLQEVQSIGQVIREKAAQLGSEIDSSGGFVKSKEDELLLQVKTSVETEMQGIHEALTSYVSSANPLKFLTAYLSRKMEEDRA